MFNGDIRLADLDDLDAISSMYHGGGESNETTTECLTLLYRTWSLIMGAKDLAKKWEEESRGKTEEAASG